MMQETNPNLPVLTGKEKRLANLKQNQKKTTPEVQNPSLTAKDVDAIAKQQQQLLEQMKPQEPPPAPTTFAGNDSYDDFEEQEQEQGDDSFGETEIDDDFDKWKQQQQQQQQQQYAGADDEQDEEQEESDAPPPSDDEPSIEPDDEILFSAPFIAEKAVEFIEALTVKIFPYLYRKNNLNHKQQRDAILSELKEKHGEEIQQPEKKIVEYLRFVKTLPFDSTEKRMLGRAILYKFKEMNFTSIDNDKSLGASLFLIFFFRATPIVQDKMMDKMGNLFDGIIGKIGDLFGDD